MDNNREDGTAGTVPLLPPGAIAKRGCFMEQMIMTPVPLTSTLIVNSVEVAIPSLP